MAVSESHAARGMVLMVPEELTAKMWTPTAPETRVVGLGFYAFMVAPRLALYREEPDGYAVSTASNYEGSISRLYRMLAEKDYAQGLDSSPWQHVEPRKWRGFMGPIYKPWEDPAKPIPWTKLGELIEEMGRERCEVYRKSAIVLSDYVGIPKAHRAPDLLHAFNSAKAVHRGRMAGTLDPARERFIDPDVEVWKLFASTPHLDSLREDRMWNSPRRRMQAVFNDGKAWFCAYEGIILGERPTERAVLTWSMVEERRAAVKDWPQPKKSGKPRTVVPPEVEVFTDPNPIYDENGERVWMYPNFEWYAAEILPLVLTEEQIGKGPVYVTDEGKPYKVTKRGTCAIGNWIATSIQRVLGDDSAAGHGYRRLCATMRYQAGWSLGNVALYLDDDEQTIKSSYLDIDWLARKGIVKTDESRPRIHVPLEEWRCLVNGPTWKAFISESRETSTRLRQAAGSDRYVLLPGSTYQSRSRQALKATRKAAHGGDDSATKAPADEAEANPPSFDPLAQPWLCSPMGATA